MATIYDSPSKGDRDRRMGIKQDSLMKKSSCLERLARPLWLLYTWRAAQVIDRGVDLVGSIF